MRNRRFLAGLLAVCLLLCLVPAGAAEPSGWLIPKSRGYAPFTDTKGTIAEDAARICCETGLIDGIDARHFMPFVGLSNAQITVISARFHKLLTGGSLEDFVPISKTGAVWYEPYANYLSEEIDGWPFNPENTEAAKYPCSREIFLKMLSAVLQDAAVTLPEINQVSATPDCNDPELLAFYRAGILSGKDPIRNPQL